jgi:CBS domain-containing protein/anti-sigma regulatory factor (Ser/Thr protein kinase)
MTDAGIEEVRPAGKIEELVYELRVRDAMRTNVVTVAPGDTMDDLRNILRDHSISGAPVMDGTEMVGIVSIEDLIRSLLQGEKHEKVGERMSRNVVTIFADEHLVGALNEFGKHRYGRLPVLDRKSGKLVGMLTKGDIIRGLLTRLESNQREEERRRYRAGHLFQDVVSDESQLVLRYHVKASDFDRAGEASSRLKKSLQRLGVHPDDIRRLSIASYEAEMNMVIFSEGGEIAATVGNGRVMVEAADRGPGIADIALAMQPGYSTAPDWVRELGFGAGMGLPNIKNCSDEFHIDSGAGRGTTIRFTVRTRI